MYGVQRHRLGWGIDSTFYVSSITHSPPHGIPSLYIPFGVEDVGGLTEKRGKEGSSEHESDDMGTPDPIHSIPHTHLPPTSKFKHTAIIQYMTRLRISTPQDVRVERQGDGHYERPRVLRASITYTKGYFEWRRQS